jgi:hypothetical protein
MVEPLSHRQTKGAATDMFYLTPPRHISTLPNSEVWVRNWEVRFALNNRHRQPDLSGPESADSVEKVFLGCRPKFFRTADAFRTRQYEGPHRLTQKRPRSFAWALRSIAVVEPAKIQLLREFRRRSIFDFCNTICQ